MIESDTHNYYNENTYTVRYGVNSAASWDKETDEVTANLPTGGFLDQSRTRYDVLTIRNQLNFNHTFAEKHAVAVVAGIETIDRRYQSFGYPRTYGYNDETLSVGNFPNGIGGTGVYQLTNWQGNNLTLSYQNSFSYTTDRYFSAFGNASYTYDSRYTVSGSVRTDASNLITDDPAYRYAPFWSVGASWQIANEAFMQQVDWIDGLALRFTYGYNGNVDKSTTFKPLVNISSSPNTVTGELTGSMSSYGNPTLRWERTGTWDIGVDFNFFKGKLYGKFDVYNKHSEDLIADVTLSAVQGTTSMRLNNGEILNRGFEMEVGSTLRISPNVTWNGVLTLSYNKN
ncbi:TonB-dependent receptor, plug, partial [human gut metagenome]